MPPEPATPNDESPGHNTGLTLRATMMTRSATRESLSTNNASPFEALPVDVLLMLRDELRHNTRALANLSVTCFKFNLIFEPQLYRQKISLSIIRMFAPPIHHSPLSKTGKAAHPCRLFRAVSGRQFFPIFVSDLW